MKNKLSRVLTAARQESRSTQMVMAITLFAFASAIVITLGQVSGILLRAEIDINDYHPQTEPFERPKAPGYEAQITPPVRAVDNRIDFDSPETDERQNSNLEKDNTPWYKNLFK